MYVTNESKQEKIDQKYHNLLKYLVHHIDTLFDSSKYSFYLLGSVGRGQASAHSDIDLEIIVHSKTDKTKLLISELKSSASDRFPDISNVSLDLATYEEIDTSSLEQFIYSTDGLLLAGQPLTFTKPIPEIGISLAQLMNQNFSHMRSQRQRELENNDNRIDAIKGRGKWLAKVGLRLALGIIVARDSIYTHDINQVAFLCSHYADLKDTTAKLSEYYTHPPITNTEYFKLSSLIDELAQIAQAESIITL